MAARKWASISDLISGLHNPVCDVAVKIAVLLLYPRCLGKGGSCFVFVLKVIVVPSRSIASLAKGGGMC